MGTTILLTKHQENELASILSRDGLEEWWQRLADITESPVSYLQQLGLISFQRSTQAESGTIIEEG